MARHHSISDKPESLVLIRSFIAVDIPDIVKTNIENSLNSLKHEIHGVKWIESENMHLTLKFLGNVEPKRLDFLKGKLAQALKGRTKFSIIFSKLDAFPDMKNPKVLWLGIANGEEHLKILAGKVEEASAEAGFQKVTRPFSAHLTLGRVRNGQRLGEDQAKALARLDFNLDSLIMVERVTLYQSLLTSKGPNYESLQRIDLI